MTKRLSSHDIGKMRKMIREGYKAEQVARFMGISLRTVYRRAGKILRQQHKESTALIEKRNNMIYNSISRGATVKDVASRTNLSIHYIREIVKRFTSDGDLLKKGWSWQTSPTRKLELHDAVNIISMMGKESARDVAARYGVTPNAVRKIWKRRAWPAAWELWDRNADKTKGPG